MEEKKLFLLDAYALIFRAYYALIKTPRITSKGLNVSAIFGFVNTIEELFRKENPTHIAVCFDPPGPTFRDEAYEKYKGERSATPEDIKLSVPYIKEILNAYNVPVIEVPGFEADDVVGTIAKEAEKEGYTTYMMTPDKDYGQLVSPNILQYKPAHRGNEVEVRGVEEVCSIFGIQRPEQVIDYLALVGDKVDNIPGCPGIGERGAQEILSLYENVEELVANPDKLTGAKRKKVEEGKESILLSKMLATIKLDVPVQERPDQMVRKPADRERLFAIFRELEFKNLIDRVGRRLKDEEKVAGKVEAETKSPVSSGKTAVKPAVNAAPSLFDFDDDGNEIISEPEIAAVEVTTYDAAASNYRLVSDSATLSEFRQEIQEAQEVGMFMVTDGDNDMGAIWIGTALSSSSGRGGYIPSDFEEGRGFVLDLMARRDILKISTNSKRDYVIASQARTDGATPLENYFDITLAHYLLQPEMRHSISDLAPHFLDYEPMESPEKSLPKKGNRKATILDVSPLGMTPWGCEQADLTRRLRKPLMAEVEKNNLTSMLTEMELPLVKVLADMEITGVRIDVEALKEAARIMDGRISAIEDEVCEMAGERFNVSSPAKVGEILFDKLELDPKAKKTKTGQYSTSEEVLEKLTAKHPIVGKIMEYRALKKLYTTYLLALPAAINPSTGKVHTNYNQAVTATGRISSTSPNLQNIPVRDDEGREIRRAFISDPGHLFLSADYSQIELRLVADFAKEETMIDAFLNDKDIHAITAAKIYHKEVGEVTSNERRNAKTANFGILYGISAFGLANRLGIPRAEAKEIIDNYFETFHTVRRYMSDAVEDAREHGYVSTKFGRKRYLPDINSKNPVVRGYAERNAINAPIQGTAADVIKRAMVDISREIERRGLRSRMIMQVHDELNFDVVPEELAEMQELVTTLMEKAYQGAVPLTASSGVATNWLDAH